jgi:N-acetylglucosaminyldiphosphoundecaprenol N-acetyl-beta-D-mannosaminyltransferase
MASKDHYQNRLEIPPFPNGELRMMQLERSVQSAIPKGASIAPCALCNDAVQSVEINGSSLGVLNVDSFCQTIGRFRHCSNSHVALFLAVHPTVVARQVEAYGVLLGDADLLVPDGAPLAALMRISAPTARRVTSTDGFLAVCKYGIDEGLRHFFVGGADDHVSEELQKNLRSQFPGIEIAGAVVPPFRPYSDLELQDLAAQIIESKAYAVWIGIGAPKQEVLAHRLRILSAAPVIVTIGATFDFVAGTKPRAPRFIRRMSLEWLYRLATEPGRLWRRYLVGNSLFLYYVALDVIRTRRLGTTKDRSSE